MCGKIGFLAVFALLFEMLSCKTPGRQFSRPGSSVSDRLRIAKNPLLPHIEPPPRARSTESGLRSVGAKWDPWQFPERISTRTSFHGRERPGGAFGSIAEEGVGSPSISSWLAIRARNRDGPPCQRTRSFRSVLHEIHRLPRAVSLARTCGSPLTWEDLSAPARDACALSASVVLHREYRAKPAKSCEFPGAPTAYSQRALCRWGRRWGKGISRAGLLGERLRPHPQGCVFLAELDVLFGRQRARFGRCAPRRCAYERYTCMTNVRRCEGESS